MSVLRRALDGVRARRGRTIVVTGPEGVGKSRLAEALREEADRSGFLVAAGRAYRMESDVPYGLFCDLLDPLLRDESPEALVAFTRGGPEFRFVCPSLRLSSATDGATLAEDIPDLRNRLLWNFPGFLDRLRRDRPLALVLEDLEHADPSSIELFHFLGRQVARHPFLLLATLAPQEARDDGGGAWDAVGSLLSESDASLLELEPLTPADVAEVVSRSFGADAEVVRGFAAALHRWTGGNPLFVACTLESLVQEGRLRVAGGRWVGWSAEGLSPPGSVRELVLRRLRGLSPAARTVADLAAVAGGRVRFALLRSAGSLDARDLSKALEELVEVRILAESAEAGQVVYAFEHPVVGEVLYGEIGLARVGLLHAAIARSLEAIHGESALEHAEELAPHIIHAAGETDPARGARYLSAAGRQALAARADREAARYLEASLALLPSGGDGDRSPGRGEILLDLARAHQRLGDGDRAVALLAEARALVGTEDGEDGTDESSDARLRAEIDRRQGLVAFWQGDAGAALGHAARGLAEAERAEAHDLEARLRLLVSACLQTHGRPDEAGHEAREALRLGEAAGDLRIRGSAHRTLLLLHTWTGPPDLAREHGEAAVALAERLEDDVARFSAHWAMAVLEGLTGHAEGVRTHLDRAGRLARELDSPVLRLQVAEIEIEHATELGDWDRGLDLAQESLRMARKLNQNLALPHLLVASGLLHLRRGELEPARVELDEAWELAGRERAAGPAAMHLSILAHAGRAALHVATEEYHEAVRVAEAGLDLVDRSGYAAWGIHRLLPILGEASLHLRDLDRAEAVSARLRADAERFGHRLGSVWADTCDALVAWHRGDVAGAAAQMERAAERLEEVESIPDAARLRRQLAGRFAELGRRDAAIRELRRVHDTFAGLGAEPELEKAREQFREVGARPPTRTSAPGVGLLTPREAEIAALVGERKSNKAIGRALGISPRTVGTHLSNIYRKMEIDSRASLGDRVRAGLLQDGG